MSTVFSSIADEARQVLAGADCLFDEAAVNDAYDRLAAALTAEYADLNPLVLCVMTGGMQTTVEVTRRMRFAFEIDYLHATRYRGAIEGGGLVWKRQPDPDRIQDRHVIVVDDILDEGKTLIAVRRALAFLKPASLKVAVLAEKLRQRSADEANAEFVGLQVPDRYVFGCGMDYKEYWRQLPAIYARGEAC